MKNLAYKLMLVCFAFLLVPVGIAEEEDECCDGLVEEAEATLEAAIVEITALAKLLGFALSDEETAELIEDAKRKFHELSKNPELAFEQQLKNLEIVIPELSGISSTCETKKKSTLFSELTIAIARHHKSNDKQITRLQATTQRLIDAVPEERLSVDMWIYTRSLVTNVQSIQGDLSMFEQESTEFLEMKERFLDWDPESDISSIDAFLTCVDSNRTKANKKVTKMFGTLANKMDRAAKSIEKMQRTDQDFSIEIFTTISNVFTPYIVGLSNLSRGIFSDNCYAKVDFELLDQIASNLGKDSR